MTNKHNKQVTASRTREGYEKRSRIKASLEGLEVFILPKNPKVQSSLRGFFAKNSYSGSRSVAIEVSSSNESSSSRSVATGASSANAMPVSTASTSRTSVFSGVFGW